MDTPIMKVDIEQAEKAIAEDDVVKMVVCYDRLQKITG